MALSGQRLDRSQNRDADMTQNETTEAEVLASPAAAPAHGEAPSPQAGVGAQHVRALDGLRFFAFLAVFVFHSLHNNGSALIRTIVSYGALGVQVFFVLSGFLIGRILIELREQRSVSLGERLRTFYIRRALRIFPLYYLALGLLLCLPLVGINEVGGSRHFFWNAAYLTNLKMFLDGQGMGSISHFWSLAVEEHFYMIAPLLLLSVGIRPLSIGLVSLWLGCAATRGWLAMNGPEFGEMLSPVQFDCLTVGVAAAIVETKGSFLGVDRAQALRAALLCGIACVPVFALRHLASGPVLLFGAAVEHWLFSVATAGLVLLLWSASSPSLTRLMTFEPFTYLGKISYGLYVFHFPCLLLAYVWLSPYMSHGTALWGLLLTVVLSVCSWRLFESPINDLKRFFPYRVAASTVPTAGELVRPTS